MTMKVIGMLALVSLGIMAVMPNANAKFVTVAAGGSPWPNYENWEQDGFRMSPSCHIHEGNSDGLAVFWIDQSGCMVNYNTNFLGTPTKGSVLYIDRGGQTFSLVAVKTFGDAEGLVSSKGGSVSLNYMDPMLGWVPHTTVFSGGPWRGIQSLLWISDEYETGIMSFTFKVNPMPEPGTPVLVGLGLAGIALSRRR